MRILVTGDKGFLGTHLVGLLRNRGHVVEGFDVQDGYDIFDRHELNRKLENIDLCMHLAAVADVYHAEKNPRRCHLVNVEGAEIVGEICSEMGVRMLFVSTVCAYGNNGRAVQTEGAPLVPTEIYAETKAMAEERLMNIPGLDLRVVRPATFYGPGMRSSLAVAVFLELIAGGHPIQIHGTGLQTRCYTHVQDVASGMAHVAEIWPEKIVYNISVSEPCSVLDLVKNIESLLGKSAEVEFVDDRNGQIHASLISSARLLATGWAPKYDLISGLQQTIEMRWSDGV